jgi:hypothetical protein
MESQFFAQPFEDIRKIIPAAPVVDGFVKRREIALDVDVLRVKLGDAKDVF